MTAASEAAANGAGKNGRAGTVVPAALTLIVALLLGVVYLELVGVALDLLWTSIPQALGSRAPEIVYTVVMLGGGGALVAGLRRRTRVYGHSPLDGLAVSDAPVRESLISLAAVVITLLSGAVLGPEAGLLALGAAVAVTVGPRFRGGADRRSTLVSVGAVGALLALVVSLFRHGTISIAPDGLQLQWSDLLGAAIVALGAALFTGLVRLVAYQIRRWADPDPAQVPRTTVAAVLIAVIAIGAVMATAVDPRMVLGSGEGYIHEVMTVTGTGTLVLIIAAKGAAYALSLGGGLRGGPIFPAMFLGAAVGALLVGWGVPGEPVVLAGAGILASTAVGLALKWPALIVSGVALGLLLGGWQLVPPALVGLVIGRLVGLAGRRLPGVGPVSDRPPEPAEPRA